MEVTVTITWWLTQWIPFLLLLKQRGQKSLWLSFLKHADDPAREQHLYKPQKSTVESSKSLACSLTCHALESRFKALVDFASPPCPSQPKLCVIKTLTGVETRKHPKYLPIFFPHFLSPSPNPLFLPPSLLILPLISSPGSPESPFRSALPKVYKDLAFSCFSRYVKICWQHRSPISSTIHKTSKTNVICALKWIMEKKKYVQEKLLFGCLHLLSFLTMLTSQAASQQDELIHENLHFYIKVYAQE